MKPTVFVSSSTESLPLVEFLKKDLSSDAEVVSWTDAPFSMAQPPFALLLQLLSSADFVVFLIDFARAAPSKGEVEPWPRSNIFFELGLAVGSLGSNRVLVVDVAKDINHSWLPSDLLGLTVLRVAGLDQLDGPHLFPRYIADEIRRRSQDVEPKGITDKPTYSCFISYSHADEAFASRLYKDLRDIGVRCWLDSHEVRFGDSNPEQVKTALLNTDKFLAIFSRASVRSQWFQWELRQALELEAKRSTTVLIPVGIDDAAFATVGYPSVPLPDRVKADFRDWRSETAYNKAFRELALSLAASVSDDRTSGGR